MPDAGTPDQRFVIIGIGEWSVGSMPMSSIGLGSCIGLILHDRDRGIGGLAHVMLPASPANTDRPGKFADTALDTLFRELTSKGCRKSSIVAKCAGGASMFKTFSGTLNIGERNISAVREKLKEKGIPVIAEDVGGTVGRTISYFPAEKGRLMIRRGDSSQIEI